MSYIRFEKNMQIFSYYTNLLPVIEVSENKQTRQLCEKIWIFPHALFLNITLNAMQLIALTNLPR